MIKPSNHYEHLDTDKTIYFEFVDKFSFVEQKNFKQIKKKPYR